MKKNMKKVPIIQKKSDLFHKIEDKKAELFIEKALNHSDDNYQVSKKNN
jgi:hypothetical protein